MDERGGELVAANKPTVVAKPLLNATVVEDGESDGCLADSANTNESERSEVFRQTDDRLD